MMPAMEYALSVKARERRRHGTIRALYDIAGEEQTVLLAQSMLRDDNARAKIRRARGATRRQSCAQRYEAARKAGGTGV